jgi:large subunit ribosomal protein L6
MSRVGKSEVKIPSSVTYSQEGQILTFKGKLGTQSYTVPDFFEIKKTESGLLVEPKTMTKTVRMFWVTTQRNLQNIVIGLDRGFVVNLDLVGVGYRAAVSGSTLTLQLGFSHDIVYPIPTGVTIKCDKPTSISITAPSKQQAGQIAAEIRSNRPPEPYKGKGVIRAGEFVVRKEGKKK